MLVGAMNPCPCICQFTLTQRLSAGRIGPVSQWPTNRTASAFRTEVNSFQCRGRISWSCERRITSSAPVTEYVAISTAAVWTAQTHVVGGGQGTLLKLQLVSKRIRLAGPPTHISDNVTFHIANWFDCLRSRKQPNATVLNGYAHAAAVIMAARSYQEERK